MKFGMLLHAHQPPGNFDSVFERAIETCYGPVMDLIEERPTLRLSMHWSGSLLEWMERHAPGRIEQIRRLAERGQVELVSAGMYEPVLTLLPRRDRLGQLRAHRAYLGRLFGVQPTTGWLTERVWESALAADLAEGGIEAVTLDDRHFLSAGLDAAELDAPYLTEYQGRPLTLLPAAQEMREAIPWEPARDALALLRRRAAEGVPLEVYADDIEKFGLWPGTYRTVIQRGWLARFLDGLVAMDADVDTDIEVVPIGEAARDLDPRGRVYLPDGSYPEMLEWSLPPAGQQRFNAVRDALDDAGLLEETTPFLRAGQYLQFLAKYPEVNHLHKRMLEVSARVARLLRGQRSWDPADLPDAVRELWRAQANCAYWHGLFGGIYYPHIRQRLWHHLLRAEAALEAATTPSRPVRVFDLDADREDEVIVTTPELLAVIDPAEGALVELSYRPAAVNLGDTVARRPEAYHDTETDTAFAYDRGRRGIFVDRFLEAGAVPSRRADVLDLGDFAGYPYDVRTRNRLDGIEVTLSREGAAPGGRARVEKRITLDHTHTMIEASSRVVSVEGALDARFGCELNLALCFREQVSGTLTIADRTFALPKGGAARSADGCTVVMDGIEVAVHIEVSPPAAIDVRPIETVARSEGGFERTPQQICVLPTWPLHLDAGEEFEARISLRLERVGAS